MRAKDLDELLRPREAPHRIIAAECHMKPNPFREKTRYPGDYERADFNDDDIWKGFVDSQYDRDSKPWKLWKEPYEPLIKDRTARAG